VADKKNIRKAGEPMADSEVRLENEAAQSTNALGPLIGVAREDFVSAVALLLRETASDPTRFIRHSTAMAQDMVKILTGKSDLAPDPKDKRFMDPAWAYNPFFRAGAQYYLAVQKGMRGWLEELELDELERNRANFIANIILDGLAPTNTLAGNPTAQKRVIDSGGLSLIKGLQNAYTDLVHNKGMVSQVDKRPFKLGENVATSKGSVVYRDEIMEVLQYAPTTDEVYAIPQLTIPPQINKAYVNDLSPEKSIIRFLTSSGIQRRASTSNAGRSPASSSLTSGSSTFIGSTPYCVRISFSRLTLAGVRPTTPILRPASCAILVIFAALRPLPFAEGGTHITTTFLRSTATACAFFGTSRSPRMMARSALPSASVCALALAPSVCTGRSLTWVCCWLLKACASACTTLRSSLFAGPTAILSVTGRTAK
jgi:hypothetical protein